MDLATWFLGLPPELLYVCLFLVLVVEGTGLPGVPFEPLFIAAGLMIDKGQLNFWLAVLCGGTGNLAGNVIGYWVGASPGHRFMQRWSRSSPGNAVDVQRWQDWFDRHGWAVVILSRWFGPIRTFTILAAGAGRMNIRSYIIFSAIGAYSWTAAWEWGGLQFYRLITTWWEQFRGYQIYLIVGIILLGLMIPWTLWWRRHVSKKRSLYSVQQEKKEQ